MTVSISELIIFSVLSRVVLREVQCNMWLQSRKPWKSGKGASGRAEEEQNMAVT